MDCINKAYTLLLIAITVTSVLFIMQPAKAEIEKVGTSCSIFVDDVVEGQPITITVQIFPAPPSGEVFSNISVGIVSPSQGISGWGPWDQKNIFTDPNGVAKATFYIPTFGSPANWNVWAYFGGQYLANNTLYYQSSHLESKFYISAAQTPTPSPTASPFPSPSPTPSPTQRPTITTGPEPPKTETLSITIVASVTLAVVLAVAAGLLIYFKKYKRAAVLPSS